LVLIAILSRVLVAIHKEVKDLRRKSEPAMIPQSGITAASLNQIFSINFPEDGISLFSDSSLPKPEQTQKHPIPLHFFSSALA
jgi:hypothetical protein